MSASSFYTVTVKEVRKETPTCVSVALTIPEELQSQFHYKAGQYITIRKNIDGEELRRSYSLCSSPLESDYRIAIKQVEDGKFSSYANQHLKAGDVLEIMPPMGNFTPQIPIGKPQHYIGFAAGSGITPILSIIKTVLQTEVDSTFTLIYGNQQVGSIIFKEEIEAIKNKYINRFQLVHVLSRERMESDLNYGRINKDKCEQLFDKSLSIPDNSEAFLCGPEEMILSVKAFLEEKGMPAKAIHFELFNSTGSEDKKKAYKETHKEHEGKICKLTVKLDDRSFDIDLPYGGDTILDAALKHGADLPYACKGGVCCTCRAKVMQGSVDMEVNYALEAEEVAQGFVLTCQAHPTSERVIIDFDQR